MPAVSKAQQRFAGMSKTAKGRKKLQESGKAPMPMKAAAEFAKTGPMEGMPMHAQGKQAMPPIPKKKKKKSKDAPPQFGKPKVDKSGRF